MGAGPEAIPVEQVESEAAAEVEAVAGHNDPAAEEQLGESEVQEAEEPQAPESGAVPEVEEVKGSEGEEAGTPEATEPSSEADANAMADTPVQTEASGEGGAGAEISSTEAPPEAEVIEGAGDGGGMSFPESTPAEAQNISVAPALPDSFASSDAICESAEGAATSVGPSTQAAAEEGVGFGPFIANELGKSFLGPFYPGYWTDNFGAKAWGDKFGDIWKDADNGWEITYALLDTTYTVIDNISNITGPLGTVFGILGYMRYLPFPPLPAIGSFLTVASKILNGLNFILDIAKLVLSGLKLIVHGLVGMFADDQTRKEFGDKLLGDVLSFAANGIAVGISAATDTSFRSGFSGARSQSKGILRSIGAGFKEQGKDALGDMAMAIRPNKFSEAYNEVFDEALEKAAVQRSITITQDLTQESDTVIAGVSGDGSGVIMSESVQAQSRLVASGTLTGGDALVATTGTSLRVVEETSEGLIHVVASDGTQLLIAKSQYTLFEEMVSVGAQELNREALKAMAKEIGGDVVQDGLFMVGGKLIEEPARSDSPSNVAAQQGEESAGAGTPVDTSQLTPDPAPPEPGQAPEDEASVVPVPEAAPVSLADQLSSGEALMSQAPEAALVGPSIEAEAPAFGVLPRHRLHCEHAILAHRLVPNRGGALGIQAFGVEHE